MRRALAALRSHGLTAKVTVGVTALFIVAIAVLTFRSAAGLQRDSLGLLSAQQFAAVSDAANDIDDAFRLRIDALGAVAAALGEIVADRPGLRRFMAGQQPLQKLFSLGVFVVAKDGIAVADQPVLPKRSGDNFAATDYFREAMMQGKAVVGRPRIGRYSKRPVVVIAVPIRGRDGSVQGVLVGVNEIAGSHIFDRMERADELGSGGMFSVVSPRDDLIVTTSDQSKVLQPLSGRNISGADARYKDGYEGSATAVNSDGVEMLSAAKRIPSGGWVLIGTLPSAVAFAPIDRLQRELTINAALVTLLVALCTGLLVRRQLLPLDRAAKALRGIPPAALPMRPLPVEGNGEVRRLLTAFNDLHQLVGRQTQRLQESEARYRALFENMVSGFVIAETIDDGAGGIADFRVLRANAAFARLIARPAEQLVGRKLREVVRDVDDVLIAAIVPAVRRGEEVQLEFYSTTVDAWFSVRAYSPAPGQLAAIVDDISERKRNEDQLRLAASVFSGTNEAILVTDADSRIVMVNAAFTRITGYSAEEVIGENPRLLKSGRQDAAFYQAFWQSLNGSGQWQGEVWNRRKNGEIYPEWLAVTTLRDHQGKVMRHIAIFSEITEKKMAEAMLWQQSNYDALTGLPNRRLLHERLEQELRKAQRENRQLALLCVDLDRFKEVNDSLGHGAGDQLLAEAALRICASVSDKDMVARLGGDEFAVVITSLAESSGVDSVASEILDRLAQPFRLANEQSYVSASIGITLFPGDADQIDVLMKNAEQAMYAAKEQGRGRFSYFTASLQAAAMHRRELRRDLRTALANGQLELYYQPIVELATGCVAKAEALLRWHHPQFGDVAPAQFIPIAEESGLLHDIGDWVFREAAAFARQLHHAGMGAEHGIQISINKSPSQFAVGRAGETWVELLRKAGIDGSALCIEITEGLLLEDRPEVANDLKRYRDAGIDIAIDDFGTGYSALSYLRKFDIDYLKIDRSFIADLGSSEDNLAIVEAIGAMAQSLGLKVIAEGIETAAQLRLVTAAGIAYGQGYYFAKPMPGGEFEVFLNRSRAPDMRHVRARK